MEGDVYGPFEGTIYMFDCTDYPKISQN